MSSVLVDQEFAEAYLGGWLSSVGLDVEYIRAERNTLYRRGVGDQEIAVLDFAGGYGSLMLGHNHPEIVAYARELLAAQIPVHAQFSRNPSANEVAAALNAIIHRELRNDEPFLAIFANSGAEAVEAAIKHAEFDRVIRVTELLDEVEANASAAAAAMLGGATLAADAYAMAGLDAPAAGVDGFETVLIEVRRRAAALSARPPLFLALEGSFHGKLVGSVQLTHNPAYRLPFSALAAEARFVPLDRPAVLKTIIEDERASLLNFVVDDAVVRLVERDFPVFGGFLIEPIQGEGGINMITADLAREIQQTCVAVGCPVIVDEIQSGMGRSGSFLASSRIGLHGDYYTLAKSLGGGVAKVSVLLVRQSRYRPDFEIVHSSTFAKDAFSCRVALKVLELLEADGGRAYQLVDDLGGKLIAMLETIRADFPEVIRDVRGTGLMLGLEFHDQSTAASAAIRDNAAVLGYVLAGYLLQAHDIRTFPTASAVNTLRFEPSIYLTDAEIGRLDVALRGACTVLRGQDARGFSLD